MCDAPAPVDDHRPNSRSPTLARPDRKFDMTAKTAISARGATPRFGIGRVHRDAGWVAVSSLATAALGAAFWAFAARYIAPQQLGVMTAVLAVIASLGSVVAAGVGDAYTALLPAVGSARVRVYRRGQRVFLALALVVSTLGAAATITVLNEVRGSIGVAVLVVIGTTVWATGALQNSTMIALGRARWAPTVNASLGLAKILLLSVAVTVIGWHSVELAAVAATALFAVVLQPVLRRIVIAGDELPRAASIATDVATREFDRLVIRTVALSTVGLGVLMLAPFLVTVFAGPGQGALFALCFSIVSMIDFVGASMAVSLVVHASSSPDDTAAMARTILLRAAVLTTLGTLTLVGVAPYALHLLNPEYQRADVRAVIAVLCLATMLRVAYLVWAAVQQSRRKLLLPLVFSTVSAGLMLALMPVFCGAWGALGGAVALLVHQVSLTAAAAVHYWFTHHTGSPTDHDDG
ncbi:hypothetical protein BCA37_20830 [Mycobacterium sp. djl-10]|nr:hypothetical protein BCA37_20830 [Mycobacterium sp. djl-10]